MNENLRACFVRVFENCFFVLKNKENKEKREGGNTFGSQFFTVMKKHRKYVKRIRTVFREHKNCVFCVFRNRNQRGS